VCDAAGIPRGLVPLDLEPLTTGLMRRRVVALTLALEMVTAGQDEVVLALVHG
jgi:hypothetical protein